jgi:hypothetical protein
MSRKAEIAKALQHANTLGSGAAVRRENLHNPEDKVDVVMKEFKHGTLHSSDGKIVQKRKQAIAIVLSEARKAKEGKW